MEISRRKFFFFGLAAGVGLYLPDYKISLATPLETNIITNKLMTLDQILALDSKHMMGAIHAMYVKENEFLYSFLRKTGEMELVEDEGNKLFGGL